MAQMIGNSPTVPGFVRRAMFQDLKQGNHLPSTLASFISIGGAAWDTTMAALAMWPGDSPEAGMLRLLGMIGCVAMHTFIIYLAPLAGVQEWNAYSAACFIWLFRCIPMENSDNLHLSIEAFSNVPLPLGVYVLFACYVVPFSALWKPQWFSYASALQQYTGNWPAGGVLIHKSAVAKLAAAFPTFPPLVESVAGNTDVWTDTLQKEDTSETDADVEYIGMVFQALNLRRHMTLRAVPCLKEIATRGKLDQYTQLDMKYLLGYYAADSSAFTDGLLKQLAAECKLSEGELLFVEVCSFPSLTLQFPRTARWRIRDAAVDSKENGLMVAGGTITIDALTAGSTDDLARDISFSMYDDLEENKYSLHCRLELLSMKVTQLIHDGIMTSGLHKPLLADYQN